MLAEVNPLCVVAVIGDAKLNAEEPTLCRGRDIHIDDTVTHVQIVQGRRPAIEEQALAVLILGHLSIALQSPVRGVSGNRECLRYLGMSWRRREKSDDARNREPKHDGSPLAHLAAGEVLSCSMTGGEYAVEVVDQRDQGE